MVDIKRVPASVVDQNVNRQDRQSVPSSSQITPPNLPDLVRPPGDTSPIYAASNSRRSSHAGINDAIAKFAKSAAPQFDSLGLNQVEKAALAAIPADRVIEIATALRKGSIPINKSVLSDVMQFNDQSLSGRMEKLNHGKQNNVYRAQYGEFDAVFKTPRKISQILRKFQNTNNTIREKATSVLDEALGFGVIPRTVFAIHSDEQGNLAAGVAMGFVSGEHPRKVPVSDVDITDHEIGQDLLSKKEKLQRNPLGRIQQRFLHGLDDFSFTDDNRVKATYKQSPFDLSDPVAKRELVKLQILDFLTQQVDRHAKNYIVDADKDSREVHSVQGIDNELSFGSKLKTLAVLDHRLKYGGTSTIVGLPEVVDQEMFNAVMKLTREDIRSLYADLLPEKKIRLAIDNLDILKQHLLALPASHVIDPQKWGDVEFRDKKRSYVARDMAKSGLPLAPIGAGLESTTASRPSLKKTGVKALASAAVGHVWLEATRNKSSFHKPFAKGADHIATHKMRKQVGDPRALPSEVESQIQALYSQTEFWHGTGRYQYAAGRNQSADTNNETVDVLLAIIQSGQLRPGEERLNIVEQTQKSISLAPARMYARSYADSHAVDLESQPRYGSSLFWAGSYQGDTNLKLAKSYMKLDSQRQNALESNTVGENGLNGWARKVRKSGLVVPPPSPDELENKSKFHKAKKIIKPSVAVAEIYQRGSDIPTNYPIVFGIKKGSVENKLDIGEALALHEVRSADPLPLSNSITHLEVPRARVQETKELLTSHKLEHLPVIAIEDCEAFLSGFSAKDVHAHDLSRPTKKADSYEVAGPVSFDTSFHSAVDVASSDIPTDGFQWETGIKYSAGLIPMRMGENGQLEVMLLKRSNLVLRDRGAWATPGGSCKPGKDGNPIVSAIRETQEELGGPLAGKVDLKPIVLNNAKSNRCFHGYPWLVNSDFRPKLQWENTGSKWVPLSEIEPESPQIMGECGAVLRHLIDSTG